MGEVMSVLNFLALRWGWIPPTLVLADYLDLGMGMMFALAGMIFLANWGNHRAGYVEALMDHNPELFPGLFDDDEE